VVIRGDMGPSWSWCSLLRTVLTKTQEIKVHAGAMRGGGFSEVAWDKISKRILG